MLARLVDNGNRQQQGDCDGTGAHHLKKPSAGMPDLFFSSSIASIARALTGVVPAPGAQ
jgi:hypothetical protein